MGVDNRDRHTPTRVDKAIADVFSAFVRWPIFILIGITDVQSRYRRSKIGQFWITISLFVMVVALGLLWSFLWKLPVSEFLPFIAVSHIFWMYLTGVIMDGPGIYVAATGYLREINLPRFTFVLSNLVKHWIILAHNLIILIPIFLYFQVPITFEILMIIPGFILTTIAILAVSTFLSVVGLRFRDVASLVASILQIAFFMTPVIWKPEALPPFAQAYMTANPFAVFLDLLRAPILGPPTPPIYWTVAGGFTLVAVILAILVFVRFRAKITYWL